LARAWTVSRRVVAGIFVTARKPIIAILAMLAFLNLIDPVSTLLER